VLRQTVPSAGGSNKEGPFADSGQPCAMDSGASGSSDASVRYV